LAGQLGGHDNFISRLSTRVIDWHDGYSQTLAPLIAAGVVITGISGAEYGIRGFLDGWDPQTGKHLWRTYTIPGPGEPTEVYTITFAAPSGVNLYGSFLDPDVGAMLPSMALIGAVWSGRAWFFSVGGVKLFPGLAMTVSRPDRVAGRVTVRNIGDLDSRSPAPPPTPCPTPRSSTADHSGCPEHRRPTRD
jgi:hypothetical protein